jgi:uncharacterized protein (DUF302 family)
MTALPGTDQTCARVVVGVVSMPSPHTPDETVRRVKQAIRAAGATLFCVIDQRDHAVRAGLELRETRLLLFGSPVSGTAVMTVAPLAAIDLPLKILVWQDDWEAVWVSYVDAEWLAARHGLAPALACPLRAAETIARQAVSP